MPPPAHTPVAQPRLPPPPPTLPSELLDLVNSLSRRLLDLEQHQVPQLASCTGPLSFHEQLAGDVRSEMLGIKRDVEELKLQVDDLDKARDRRAGLDHIQAIQLHLESITKLYRQAVLASKKLIDNSGNLASRDELFYTAAKAGGGGKKQAESPDDALMLATSDVTEGLRRTLQLMQQEVDRSMVSNELLESQTATLKATSDQYSIFSTLLTTSKALITSLERADLLDRLILAAAFLLFGLVCAWVFKRRVVDKGLRVAGALGKVVARGGGTGAKGVKEEVVAAVTTIVASASSVVSTLLPSISSSSSSVRTRATPPAAGKRKSHPGHGHRHPHKHEAAKEKDKFEHVVGKEEEKEKTAQAVVVERNVRAQEVEDRTVRKVAEEGEGRVDDGKTMVERELESQTIEDRVLERVKEERREEEKAADKVSSTEPAPTAPTFVEESPSTPSEASERNQQAQQVEDTTIEQVELAREESPPPNPIITPSPSPTPIENVKPSTPSEVHDRGAEAQQVEDHTIQQVEEERLLAESDEEVKDKSFTVEREVEAQAIEDVVLEKIEQERAEVVPETTTTTAPSTPSDVYERNKEAQKVEDEVVERVEEAREGGAGGEALDAVEKGEESRRVEEEVLERVQEGRGGRETKEKDEVVVEEPSSNEEVEKRGEEAQRVEDETVRKVEEKRKEPSEVVFDSTATSSDATAEDIPPSSTSTTEEQVVDAEETLASSFPIPTPSSTDSIVVEDPSTTPEPTTSNIPLPSSTVDADPELTTIASPPLEPTDDLPLPTETEIDSTTLSSTIDDSDLPTATPTPSEPTSSHSHEKEEEEELDPLADDFAFNNALPEIVAFDNSSYVDPSPVVDLAPSEEETSLPSSTSVDEPLPTTSTTTTVVDDEPSPSSSTATETTFDEEKIFTPSPHHTFRPASPDLVGEEQAILDSNVVVPPPSPPSSTPVDEEEKVFEPLDSFRSTTYASDAQDLIAENVVAEKVEKEQSGEEKVFEPLERFRPTGLVDAAEEKIEENKVEPATPEPASSIVVPATEEEEEEKVEPATPEPAASVEPSSSSVVVAEEEQVASTTPPVASPSSTPPPTEAEEEDDEEYDDEEWEYYDDDDEEDDEEDASTPPAPSASASIIPDSPELPLVDTEGITTPLEDPIPPPLPSVPEQEDIIIERSEPVEELEKLNEEGLVEALASSTTEEEESPLPAPEPSSTEEPKEPELHVVDPLPTVSSPIEPVLASPPSPTPEEVIEPDLEQAQAHGSTESFLNFDSLEELEVELGTFAQEEEEAEELNGEKMMAEKGLSDEEKVLRDEL